MVSIILVDGDRFSRERLTKSLNSFAGLNVESAADAIAARPGLNRCDLVLISTSLPKDGAYQFLRLLQREYPRLRAIILDHGDQTADPLRYFEAGAYSVICRSLSAAEISEHIQRVSRGEAVIQPGLAPLLIKRLSELSVWMEDIHLASHNMVVLTRRERQVLALIGREFSNQEIASHLFIEVGTVKNHVHRILAKLNVSSRREAANLAVLHHDRPRKPRLGSLQQLHESI